ncbi:MAG: RNA methyltransferase, partial [Bacteroidales bacterium]|nr:RNA methyltransferase [Bacteroidales bacterium]
MATYIAKTLQGLEPVLAKELKELGATEVKETGNRAVLFEATQRVLYSINYQCRTALRILKTIKSFDIKTQDDLY